MVSRLISTGGGAVLALLAPFAVHAADCPDPAPTARDLRMHVEAAGLAFAAMDELRFHESAERASAAIPCVRERLDPLDIAGYHRMQGLRAHLAGDREATIASFRAALSVDPDYAFPVTLVPEGGPVHALYVTASTAAPSPVHAIEVGGRGTAYVNGVASGEQPLDYPAVLQVLDGETVLLTEIRPGGEPALPLWDDPPGVQTTVTEYGRGLPTEPIDPEPRSGQGLWIAAVATGVVAVGLYGGAAAARTSYDRDPTADGRHLTNGLYLGSVGVGVAAVGIGSFAAFAGRF